MPKIPEYMPNLNVWTTRTGQAVQITKMSDSHLHNTILLIQRELEKGAQQIGANSWPKASLELMEKERVKRKLPMPLLPYTTLEYRKGNI